MGGSTTTPPVVALVGPTGSGKSALAMQAATTTGAHIVAIDAFTVYRQMTVGTAKPTTAERAAVPHHMVDRLDVEEDCTVQWFQGQARAAIDACLAQGRPVVLVGGSGLYFRAVVDPLEFPPTDAVVRERLTADVEPDPHAAHAALAVSDPAAAAKIDPGNARRITRALEVAELTGRPFSSFAGAWERFEPAYPSLRVLGLDVPRGDLALRLADRADAMIAEGWVEECCGLQHRQLSTTAAQAIGYAELLAWLRTRDDPVAEGPCAPPPAEILDRIVTRTRRYGTRQQRWFAKDPRVQWAAPRDAGALLAGALVGGR